MIAGITKVRNEEEIISDTVEHFLGFCDHLFIYDDDSTDETVDICRSYQDVTVKEGEAWDPNRFRAERDCRQAALDMALLFDPDWIVQFDADERFELPTTDWRKFDAVRMKLFDFYITPSDKHLPYTERTWMGPEFRTIIMMYRPFPGVAFEHLDQREMRLPRKARVLSDGYVKHYGKAISVEQWEQTCDYYAEHFPEPYKTKWANRRGKAVHTDNMSDFGRPLITWDQKDQLGTLML